MVLQIEEDLSRFKQIIRGKIKQNLRKYISHGEMIGKKGKDIVSIPLPQIRLPRFQYGDPEQQGVAAGEGKEGDPVGQGEGGGTAGNQPGQHIREVEISIAELAEIMGEELELPRIEPKGKKELVTVRNKYSSIRRTGPETLRHFKRTYKEALKRQITAKEYDPARPRVVPVKEDLRYRSWKTEMKPESNAVIIYMMDVSGSMGEEQKEIVRIESFWIDTWLRSHYPGLQSRYIIHDAVSREVDRETFFTTRESGGTVISSAYELCAGIIERDYSASEWNIYPFHFSDGDNWSNEDNERCFEIIESRMLEHINMFCYGQVESLYGSGRFIDALNARFETSELVLSSRAQRRRSGCP
jgi:hypothetical protein